MFCAIIAPPYEIDRIFVVLFCEMEGIARDPGTPRTVLPAKRFALVRSLIADAFRETVPPDV